jgi:DNA-binding MarR family transcriptional regulator
MNSDVPDETVHEKRAMLYIKQVNDEIDQDKPANLSTLSEESDWDSKYFTRSWKKLEPKGLVEREKDGISSRLQLTEKGKRYVELMLEMNQVLEE